MSLPKKVKLGAHKYDVSQVKDFKVNGDRKLLGQVNSAELTIKLEKNQAPSVKVNSLMHEILHGIILETPFSIYKRNEELVIALTDPIVRMIIDNPSVIEYIQKEGGKNGREIKKPRTRKSGSGQTSDAKGESSPVTTGTPKRKRRVSNAG